MHPSGARSAPQASWGPPGIRCWRRPYTTPSAAFFDGFQTANYVAAGVAAAGAVMALALLPAQPTTEGGDTPVPRAPGSPAAASARS